jgi:hypothetical protein
MLLAVLIILIDRLPLLWNPLGILSERIFLGSQLINWACFRRMIVDIPAGPVLFSLPIKLEI